MTKAASLTHAANNVYLLALIGFTNDNTENNTSKSHSPWTLLMAPAQQEETILVEGTDVVPAKRSPKIKSELFSLL